MEAADDQGLAMICLPRKFIFQFRSHASMAMIITFFALSFVLSACSASRVVERCPAGSLRCGGEFNAEAKAPKAGKRIAMDLQDVQGRLTATPPESLLRELASDVTRERLLYIQALAKVYSSRDLSKDDAKTLEKFFGEIKDIEGLAGDYSRRVALSTLAKKGGAPQSQIDIMESERRDADRRDIKKLEEMKWSPDPLSRINHLMENIAEIDFGKRDQESSATNEGIRDLAKSERERLKSLGRFIERDSYSEQDLEKGLHTLRRSLRWVIQSMSASEGLYRLAEAKSTGDRELEVAYGNSKYVRFVKVPGVEALPLTRSAVLQLAKFVVELGLVKDFKEFELDYALFLEHHRFAADAPAALAAAHVVTVRAFGKDVNAEKIGHELYAYYLEQDPLKVIAQDLKN